MTSSVNKPSPPAIRRVAITVPPKYWFHGIAKAMFVACRQTLVDLGCSVFEVPVEAFLPPDAARLPSLIADIRSFRPEIAIGLPRGALALLCRMPPERDGYRRNLFTDVLELPTVVIWDHEPVGLASQLLDPLPDQPAKSTSTALEALRRTLSHPLLLHCSRDTGQTRIMRELGLVNGNRIMQLGSAAVSGFARPSRFRHAATNGGPDVGFIGHLYETPAYHDPALAALAQGCVSQWIERDDAALWDVLSGRLAAMPPPLRNQLKLSPNETYFWHFAHRLMNKQAQTQMRLRMLGATRVPVACYCDGYAVKADVPPNVTWLRESVPFGAELAALFARHAITVDVLAPSFVHGYSIKPVIGFAAGGFVLVNRKQDFIDAFGDVGAAVSYRGADELGGKIDRFLTNPRQRHELADEMRKQIMAKHTEHQFFATLLHEAHRRGAQKPSDRPQRSLTADLAHSASLVLDLLPAVRTRPEWQDATAESRATAIVVTTSRHAWAYAAEVPMPALPATLKEPYLRLRLRVEEGRIGICRICPRTGDLLAEQVVSVTREVVSLNLELPVDLGVEVIFRNTIDGVTRVFISEAALCERRLNSALRPPRAMINLPIAIRAVAGALSARLARRGTEHLGQVRR